MNYAQIIPEVYEATRPLPDHGRVASYIPELARVDRRKYGVHLCSLRDGDGEAGDALERFSIQSIVKVLALVRAYQFLREDCWHRVDVEPSGNPYNSLVQLESDEGIPRNPFINAGALVIADMLLTHLDDAKADFLRFVQEISDNSGICYNESVARSEKAEGYRNAALGNFLKSFGNLDNEPERVLDFYFELCSLEMNCRELAQTFLFLANRGVSPWGDRRILTDSQTKRVNALMLTCGFYDESGEFAFRVGLPGKSGVGGGIVAIYPEHYAIATWSPGLNEKGNSYRGMRYLERFTTRTGLSIF